MNKPTLFFLAFTASILNPNAAHCGASETPVDAVRAFYTAYLDFDYNSAAGRRKPDIPKSKPFTEAIEKNAEICREYSTGICGWGVDGDPYLGGAQEIERGLNSTNSGLTVKEVKSGYVQVQLNVYPSISDAEGYYTKTMIYKMVREDGSWVVDDISSTLDGDSDRKKMLEENSYYLQPPDPDSLAAKAEQGSDRKEMYATIAFIVATGIFLLFHGVRFNRK